MVPMPIATIYHASPTRVDQGASIATFYIKCHNLGFQKNWYIPGHVTKHTNLHIDFIIVKAWKYGNLTVRKWSWREVKISDLSFVTRNVYGLIECKNKVIFTVD